MSQSLPDSTRDTDDEREPRVPPEVIDAIDNIAEGNTATKDEIESVLKF